jgi:Fe-S-cluster containining protein
MNPTTYPLQLLESLYEVYDTFAGELDIACTKGCAVCCTRNVTLTSLEAALLIKQLDIEMPGRWQALLSAAAELPRFKPEITINQLAELCINDESIPEEEVDPLVGPCPLLMDDTCIAYEARPLACRAMISTTVCSAGESAEMPEFVLTANNVFLQYLEAADSRGVSGNLIDVLLYFHKSDDAMDIRRFVQNKSKRVLANRAMPALMIPPEHRRRMTPLLEKIQAVFQKH